ncbi:MAG: substrate-binding domain-containing protein [Spirochaeta sp.]|nr:substrate-binding domain-containing protein [Spirochaeta sp.]
MFPAEIAQIGGSPRNTYRTWIGYFHEDEEEKGFLLARHLISAARAPARAHRGDTASETVRVVGVGGDTTWYGSALRERGLQRAVDADPAATLLQTVPTRWTPTEGREMTTRLMDRYTDISVIWAASDQLALGAVDAVRARGETPGETVFTGGLDLSLVGLQAVAQGDLTATVAASPLAWAQILIYVYDYLHGIDFAARMGTEIFIPPETATRSTAPQLIQERERYDEIDYRRYSRHYRGADAQDLIGAPGR